MVQAGFSRVILYAREHRANQDVHETLQRLKTYLQQRGISTYRDPHTAVSFALELPVLSREQMGQAGDLISVVGGDGSLLSAARMAVHVNVPVIGVNRGRLGFLTDLNPHHFESTLDGILSGHYQNESRFLLRMGIYDEDALVSEGHALNDVVLSRGVETHLVAFDVLINQQFVSQYRSDGLIVSTPTGSTAYALSAGGPIMHPQLDAMVIVPMFSHSLSSRPLVIGGQSSIALDIHRSNEHALHISCDGHESFSVYAGQRVVIEKYQHTLQLLHPLDYHYYDTLRIKLGWGSTHPFGASDG